MPEARNDIERHPSRHRWKVLSAEFRRDEEERNWRSKCSRCDEQTGHGRSGNQQTRVVAR
eukprot:12888978-Prorocentrum_lima.AAC.1